MTKRGLRVLLVTAATAALVSTVVAVLPAAADPTGDGSSSNSDVVPTPSTAAEAKLAWLDAATKAEAANEALLTAQEAEKTAQLTVADTKVSLTQATLDASTAQAAAVQAAAEYAGYREDLAQFASASFRGAQFGELSALLTAESTSDLLDELSSLAQVADSTRTLMEEALAAKEAADTASEAAATATAAAAAATDRANQALADASAATKKVEDQKAALDVQVAGYHRLFSTLTGQEREAAMQAQQAAWEQQAVSADQLQQSENQIASQAGSTAPVAENNLINSNDTDVSPKARVAIQAALSKLGARYVYGASGPSAFDCSGLTSWAWAQAGITIPRTSSSQASLPVVPLNELRPGDLVTYYSPVHHVALYIGNGQIVHASTEGVPVYVTSVYRGGPYPVGHRVTP